MAKEIEIPIPTGYEIDKEKTDDKKIVFKQKEESRLIIDLDEFNMTKIKLKKLDIAPE